jgi:hypothetical protein
LLLGTRCFMKMSPVSHRLLALGILWIGLPTPASAQSGPVKVTIQAEKAEAGEGAALPVDPVPRVKYGMNDTMMPGLGGPKGEQLTISPQGGHQIYMMVDGVMQFFGQINGQANADGKWASRMVPLGKGQGGKIRHGVKSEWVTSKKIHVTQIVEIIPSKTPPANDGSGKRHLDVMLVRYIVENKDSVPHSVGIRNTIDIYLIDNDGALFASPTTHKDQIINGHEFKGDKLPAYVQVLQRPNIQNPGFVTHFTLKLGKLEPPTRFVCTNLTACFMGGWEAPAQPAGDSAVAIFFDPKPIPAGGKRDMAYAYGIGIASNPEAEGRVNMQLAGDFEQGKEFTVTAYVDDPQESQSLTLELPPALERVQGKAVQTVPPPAVENGQSIVVWKVRVAKLGTYPIKIRSNTGVVFNTLLKIEKAEKAEFIRIELKAPEEGVGQEEKPMKAGPKGDAKDPRLDRLLKLLSLMEAYGSKLASQSREINEVKTQIQSAQASVMEIAAKDIAGVNTPNAERQELERNLKSLHERHQSKLDTVSIDLDVFKRLITQCNALATDLAKQAKE